MKKDARPITRLKQKREYCSPFAEIVEQTDDDIITTSSTETQVPGKQPDTGEWDLYSYDEFAW